MKLHFQLIQTANQDDFFSLFEDENFDHQQSWKTCYCRFYHTTYDFNDWIKRSGIDNKEDAKKAIAENQMHGYLAYDEDKCVGWINAGPITLYHRLIPYLEERFVNDTTAIVICFVLHADYRGKKVASALLDHAIQELRNEGFNTLISLPRDIDIQEKNYRGPKQMYANRGFVEYKPEEDSLYMIKDLKNGSES